jgi:DNA-binding transcriptional ArsR family regulator
VTGLIRIHLGHHPEEKLRFAFSPLSEMVWALEALVHPKRHPLHLRWVLDWKPRLPRELWREIRALSFAYKSWQLGMFSPAPEGGFPSFGEELERLRAMELTTFVADVARAFRPDEVNEPPAAEAVLGDRQVQERLMAEAVRLSPAYAEPARQLMTEPEALRERMLAMLSAFWEVCFAAEWQRIEPVLAEDVVEKGELLGRVDLYTFFRKVMPRCAVQRRERLLLFNQAYEAAVDLDEHPCLLLVPSCFTWGRTRVECDPPWAPALIYPAGRPETPLPLPPEGLPQLFGALAHEARLQILGLCWSAPRSTQELARLLQLTEGAVSKHLHVLQAAGFVRGRRQSYYVLYQAVPEVLRAVSPALVRHLSRADLTTRWNG